MRRIPDGVVRNDWRQLIRSQGLIYNDTDLPDGTVASYWREGPFYTFSAAEIEQLHADARTLFAMCVDAGDYLADRPDVMSKMGIPDWAQEQVVASWQEEPACGSVYGRFDVRYGGSSELDPHTEHNGVDPTLARLKLYEFNADTPTSLLESALLQWSWFTDTGQGADQWNSLHEDLVDAFRRNLQLVEHQLGGRPVVYFACSSEDHSGEDVMNVLTLKQACAAAGYETREIFMEDIFCATEDGRFYEYSGAPGVAPRHLDVVVKLYPWETMVADQFGKRAFIDMRAAGRMSRDGRRVEKGTVWIEPPYKMLWSNKGLLAVLWKLFGTDPERGQLLLPAYFEDEKPAGMTSYARKPLLGREGANVSLVETGRELAATGGSYGKQGWVVQELAVLPNFPDLEGDNHPVLGIWMVDGEPAGLGIRESRGYVTDNLSSFAPHTIGYQA